MKFKGYLFDGDGTLYQSPPCYPYNITKATLEACGARRPTFEEAEEFWFCSANRSDFIKEHFGIEPDFFWTEFHKLDEAHLAWCAKMDIPYVFVYSDVYVLNELKKQGVKLGLVTGTGAYTLSAKLDLLKKELGIIFDSTIVANEKHLKPKPHADGIQSCLHELNILEEEACYVGDLVVDIQMAQNAKVFSIRINRDRVKFPGEVKPDLTIRSLTELLS